MRAEYGLTAAVLSLALAAGGIRVVQAGGDPRVGPAKLLGAWRVVGCATSPQDPANCAKGDIAFEATRWTVTLPCCKASKTYSIVSATATEVQIQSEGDVTSVIRIGKDGTAHWNAGFGGRVGELSFVRVKP